ncbi:mercuric reductase [Cupriavidus sp. TA19]|uniref:FAD-containing oxidoreductase n=1 Tax=unclassified Cupriavidus TaxID=2640874 RepID=UPI000E2EDE1B|nr:MULTISPECIES: FAD-containing oxidoreductase [unclassified Cupriavidus]BDB24190.1 FAD-containing oxidoreductase [Cupriavidus sp. P-10]GLC93930.1 mercuric reductase [Cupriavidus sp. TA19]
MAQGFDAIIIGTGQAGPALAARLSGAGMNVAVIERARFGGTCVNTGCIPTKTLIASAYAAHLARRAAEYGVTIGGPVAVDMKQVKQRKDEISGRSANGIETWMRGLAKGSVYHGHAVFETAHSVRVNGELLEADRIFINVGGRALVPPMPGLDQVPYLTNSGMMDVDYLPEHLVVIGGSYIGLEFAQMYRRFGAKVTVVEKGPRLIQREDEDVSQAVHEILAGEGVEIRLNANCLSARREGNGIAVGLDCTDGSRNVQGSHLLLAVGRVPNTDDLQLDKAGIEADDRGYIKVDEQLQTNVPGIWALGDCNGRGAFTHTSYHDYEIVAANLLDKDPRKLSDRITAYALFTDPPLGRAGMTETEARQSGRRVLVGRRPMSRVGRAVEKGESQGFMKVVVDADSKLILGAAILGLGGDEVIHTLLDVMYARAPYTTVSRAMHIHPTVSELVPTLLQELA